MAPLKPMLTIFLFLLLAGAAFGQVLEVGAFGGANRITNGVIVPTDPNLGQVRLDNGWRFGFRVTVNTHRFLGHEAGYSYVRTNWKFEGGEAGTAAHQGFYDFLVYGIPEGSRVRPFIAGGAQFTNFIFPGLSVSSGGGSTKFGLNYGAGVKAKASEHFLIRFDFRQYASPKPDFNFPAAPQGWIRLNEFSAGFAYTL